MDDLSEEENEVEELNTQIHQRGFTYLVPLGRTFTVQEEKNDADDDGESEETGSAQSGGPPSVAEDDGENESAQDLDASMEDLDEEGGESEDEEMEDGEEYEEQPSMSDM
ncbi:hypothetical protein K435DRAFT_781974 [Dendrothele bispora CBS 962.96]|uniref:Uncharacterized protein n=1 Tax=Dendrothele bispora (strain CBS 962.96) TaxID=1314807 RepID=A0A4S8LHL4_DENBC|nr:hypothetical protein K435DRAFT_781974 [Dendrothele bispora CBS 962.96]